MSWGGGPVMHGRVDVYLIFYGAWSAGRRAILADFVSSVGNSSWLDIATTYSDGAGPASADIALGGTTVDAYSHGTRLSDAAIGAIVTGALARGAVPASESAVYAVLASGDIDATSGFCSAYCGWHETLPYGALTIKYAFIGGAWQCPDACSPVSRGPTPNGDLGADAMVSTLAHELVETITDPGQDAWMDATGYENADKCAWVFSGVFATASHAAANTPLGSRDFLIQVRAWSRGGREGGGWVGWLRARTPLDGWVGVPVPVPSHPPIERRAAVVPWSSRRTACAARYVCRSAIPAARRCACDPPPAPVIRTTRTAPPARTRRTTG